MFFNYDSNKSSAIGLDIDQNLIKITKLSKVAGSYKLDDIMLTEKNNIEHSLLQCFSKSNKNFSKIKIALAIEDRSVLSKIIQLDSGLTEAEIANYLDLNLEKFTGLRQDEVCFDFRIQKDNIQNSNGKVTVQFIAARTSIVNEKTALLQKGPFSVQVIDIESYALARLVAHQFGKQVVMINYFKTNLLLIGILAAEDVIYWKVEPTPHEFDHVVQIISKHIELFNLTNHINVEKILLSGEINMFNLPTIIERETKISTAFLLPFSNMLKAENIIKGKLHMNSHQFALSCGLALSGLAYG